MKHLLWLLVATTALAGCSDEGAEDPAASCDLEMNYIDEAGACVPHTAPALIVDGIPGTVEQYQTTAFTWTLDPGTYDAVHSMDSRIKINTEATTTDNATEPDAWGEDVATAQHKDLPQNLTGDYTWGETGTFYLRGYMLIDGVNTWYDLGMVEVTGVSATGNRTAISIDMGDAGPELSAESVTVTVGDGATFTNNMPYDYSVVFDGDDCPADATISSDGGTKDFDFLVPGSCKYTLSTPAGGNDPVPDPGELTGTISVVTP